MCKLKQAIQKQKTLRVIGFDDAPFAAERGAKVNVSGIVCTGTRFEGMLWGEATKDGDDATDVITNMLLNSKFLHQVHAVLLDGVAIGGFNVIRLKDLQKKLGIPCITVMRKMPDFKAIENALKNFSDCADRLSAIAQAGDVHEKGGFVFQCVGCDCEDALAVLKHATDNGKVPEALRLAHLIGAAIITGESSSRA